MLVTMVHHSNSHDHGGDWDCRRQRVTHQLLKNEKISWQKHNGVASSDLCTRNCFIKSPSTTWSLSFNRDIKSPAFLFMASQWWLLGYGDGLNALCWVLNMGSGLRPRGPCQILEILVTKGTAEKSVCQLQAAREQVNIWVWGKGKVRSTMLDMK